MRFTGIVSLLVATTLVSAGKLHTPHPTAEILPSKYIIQYEDHILHSDFVTALEASGIHHQVDHEYPLLHGASIKVHSDHEAEAIAALDGVKNLWPVTMHTSSAPSLDAHIDNERHSKRAYDPISDSLHHMTGVDILQKQYKLTGKGIKVGIIDSGVDYTHPAFAMPGAKAGCLGKGCRFVAGYDYLGDNFNPQDPSSAKPDLDPIDHCQGHGTHVAGIVGANALHIETAPLPQQPFIGVAPDVTFGAYRALGCEGNGPDDAIMAAMERAYADGMDIINLSAGGGPNYKSHPAAVLGDKLIAQGISFVVAGGNDGTSGLSMVSDLGLGDRSTSVASFDNNYRIFEQFTYQKVQYSFNLFADDKGNFAAPARATIVPLLKVDGTLNNGCDAAQFGNNVKGQVVLYALDSAACDTNAAMALGNAAGVAVHLLEVDVGTFVEGRVTPNPFPLATITPGTVQSLLAAHKVNPSAPITWRTGNHTVQAYDEAHESVFSSYGLDGDLRSKPDVSAPGGKILSTYPLAKGSYKVDSGTSMAAPYIAGVHALLMQARRANRSTLRGDQIRRILKNTATISHTVDGKSIASVTKQGAGLVNALNAVLATTSVTPDHIDLLDTVRFQKTAQIILTNSGLQTETYTLSHVPADALAAFEKGKTFPLTTPIAGAHHATVSFTQPTIRIAAGRSARITLQFQEPVTGDASEFIMYSGFIVATPQTQGAIPVHVPYAGMKGDNSLMPIMDTDSGYPKLALLSQNGTQVPIPDNYVFDTRPNGQKTLPLVFNTRLGSHTPSFQIRVQDAKTKEFVGYLSDAQSLAKKPMGRNKNTESSTGEPSFNTIVWSDGKVVSDVVDSKPVGAKALVSGDYTMVIAAQKKFTEGVYPRDFEVYEMATIKVVADGPTAPTDAPVTSGQGQRV